ncbi:caspase family protein [Streptomyces sp. NPDC001852]|uniref:effector-associated domain 2-containing protein n=1 Tax=Streptomyces sp. NPDC001852 TaxID=3364619 RepID=UPI0036853101
MSGPADSSAPRVDPARVHALIVGIEAYEAGVGWDLPGPARDAVAFHRLLRAAGVPEPQLRLHLAPLPPYVPDVGHRPADHATLRRVLVRDLPQAAGDFLCVWWGGHGVLDRAAGHTRLFCADATTHDKVSIDLESALARYAGDAVPGFTEQLWIVDACETFEEALGFRDPLPSEALPAGRRTLAHRQTLLRAAGRGRQAVNDPVRATGLFSDVLLGLLTGHSSVLSALLDPEELFTSVRDRIAELREAGRTLQQPEMQLRAPGRTEVLAADEERVPEERPASALRRAVEALLAYPSMSDPLERQAVVTALGPELAGTLPRHSRARTDAVGILTALARQHPDALWELYEAVLSVDGHPGRRAELGAALRELAHSRGTGENAARHVR